MKSIGRRFLALLLASLIAAAAVSVNVLAAEEPEAAESAVIAQTETEATPETTLEPAPSAAPELTPVPDPSEEPTAVPALTPAPAPSEKPAAVPELTPEPASSAEPTAVPETSMEPALLGEQTPAADDTNGDGYHDEDAAAINAMIDNNGLQAEKDAPDTWDFATWDESTPKRITTLDVSNFNLTGDLTISNYAELKNIDCSNNLFTTLSTQNNPKLVYVDASGCTALTSISGGGGALDISDCTALENLGLFGWTSVNASGCSNLKEVDGFHNGNVLTSLDVSNCTSLERLSLCIEAPKYLPSQLASLNVSGCTALTYLNCSLSLLTELDVSGLTSLQELVINTVPTLERLNVSGCTALTSLRNGNYAYYGPLVQNSSLTSLDVSSCTALKELFCYSGKLTSLDVSNCTQLETLRCGYNAIESLNTSQNAKLRELSCPGNLLTRLDTSGLTSLQTLDCSDNQITSLDIASASTVRCDNNPLSTFTKSYYFGFHASRNGDGTIWLDSGVFENGIYTATYTARPGNGAHFDHWEASPGSNYDPAETVTHTVSTNTHKYLTAHFVSDADDVNQDGFHDGDVAVINGVIENNGLQAEKDSPEAWDFATWNELSIKRIKGLNLAGKGLTGTLDLGALQYSPVNLDCSNNQIARLISSADGMGPIGNNPLVYLIFGPNGKTPLNVTIQGEGDVRLDDGATYGGARAAISGTYTATPKPGYVFDKWIVTEYEGNVAESQENPFTLDGAFNAIAVFIPDPADANLDGYHDGDVAVINQLIDTHSLIHYEQDKPESWTFATWDSSVPKRITGLQLSHTTNPLSYQLNVYQLEKLKTLDCSDNWLRYIYLPPETLDSISLQCGGNPLQLIVAGRGEGVGYPIVLEATVEENGIWGGIMLDSGSMEGGVFTGTYSANPPAEAHLEKWVVERFDESGVVTDSKEATTETLSVTGDTTEGVSVTAVFATDDMDVNKDGYNDNDVATIGAIIDGNGLAAQKDQPESWGFATWNDSEPKRISGLSLASNGLTGNLDVSKLPALTTLVCNDNRLNGLIGSNSLKNLNCANNQITGRLNLFGSLDSLDCSGNNISNLGLGHESIGKAEVNISNNPLTMFGIPNTNGVFLYTRAEGEGSVWLESGAISQGKIRGTYAAKPKEGYRFEKWLYRYSDFNHMVSPPQGDIITSTDEKLDFTSDPTGKYNSVQVTAIFLKDDAPVGGKVPVPVPKLKRSYYAYTGFSIRPEFNIELGRPIDYANIWETKPGEYTAKLTLADPANYEWDSPDNKSGSRSYTWHIVEDKPKKAVVDGNTGMKIESAVDGITLPPLAELAVVPQTDLASRQDKVESAAADKKLVGLFDIKLLDEGKEIQPGGKVKLRIPLTKEQQDMKGLIPVFIDDKGDVHILEGSIVNGFMEIFTDHFSMYGVIADKEVEPTTAPTTAPTAAPTASPTGAPTAAPTTAPTAAPSANPSTAPSISPAPTAAPTSAPTTAPSQAPGTPATGDTFDEAPLWLILGLSCAALVILLLLRRIRRN